METAPVAESLSFIDLFVHADWVVKSVMILLAVGSLWSWAIIIDKTLKLGKLNKEAAGFEAELSSGRALEDIAAKHGTQPKEPFPKLLVAVTSAWGDYKGKTISASQGDLLVAQIDRELNHVIATEADVMEDGLSLLAVVATASPFVGLFGTVWGIMNAFSAIASQGDTNLATVAPAISEALFATAIGLGAAIPAYIAYNLFNAKVARFTGRLEGFADELMVSVTRRLGDKLGGTR
ncbi:MotA/TolQ/ExbB proton channel family protein [Asticcacaulis sp. YBE204]|uniref:MotA/TolQ/ExbB proton channel family protein n=1 Tax=Asticcacaulis sp. YBE204 TaxID=1282363 RepID=UPI0003C3B6B2|nr:MotA/TolQ/ExbB proton channel family protein [Asticcacaulis sp. YBE204]ESQ80189.1 biopolymer transporter ExbB [Asticcacaulis sp. YBE204]